MLVDARNSLYRAIYAVRSDRRSGIKPHYFVVLLRQLTKLMNVYRPTSVHIFWDAPRHTVWRRSILQTYKDRSTSNYVEGLAEDLEATTIIANEFFANLNVRQYERKQMEADDLIYTAISILHPFKTVIVSSDSDMIQMPYRFNSCTVCDPKEGEVPLPFYNPVYLKALVGDKADSIDGYYGIGPIKGTLLLKDRTDLEDFLKLKGSKIFNLNLLLIDLSLNPRLLANTIYMRKQLATPVNFSKDAVMALITKHKVQGLQTEFADLILPFKNLT